MTINRNKISKSIAIPLVLAAISVIMQILVVPHLPEKYFYDSNNILSIANGTTDQYYDNSYLFAGSFFEKINILNLNTFEQWSIVLTIFGIIAMTLAIKNKSKICLRNLIILIGTTVFLNIYIFRISKDFIQWVFWILISLSLLDSNKKRSTVLTLILFVLEYILFRKYYIAIYFGYILIKHLISKTNSVNKTKYMKVIIITLIIIFLALTILQTINPSMYYRVTHIREIVNLNRDNSTNALTIINDILDSKNIIFYMLNFIINFARIILPIELTMKGIIYVPFILFQIYLITNVLKANKQTVLSDEKTKKMFAMFISFLIISSVFEPDFGSLIRHEISCSPIFLTLIFIGKEKRDRRYDKN